MHHTRAPSSEWNRTRFSARWIWPHSSASTSSRTAISTLHTLTSRQNRSSISSVGSPVQTSPTTDVMVVWKAAAKALHRTERAALASLGWHVTLSSLNWHVTLSSLDWHVTLSSLDWHVTLAISHSFQEMVMSVS